MANAINVTGAALFLWGGEELGTCQFRPRILFRREFEPIWSDVGGLVPYDWCYMGQDALVIADFTRFDIGVVQTAQADSSAGDGTTDSLENIGTMMVSEGMAKPLTIIFRRTGQIIRFPASWLQGPDVEEYGTRHQIERLIFYCARKWSGTTGPLWEEVAGI
jgi:hypothetical protein